VGRPVPRIRGYEAFVLLSGAAIVLLMRVLAHLRFAIFLSLAADWMFGAAIGAALLAGFAVRLAGLAASHGPSFARRRLGMLLRPASLLDIARLSLLGLLVYWTHTWLKVMVPVLNSTLFDGVLYRLENVVHFGINPGRFILALFPYPFLWRAVDTYYATFMPSLLLGIGWAGTAFVRRERARFAAGFAILWISGSWIYLALPSLGPCYVFPADYAEMRRHAPVQAATQDLLARHYAMMCRLREGSPPGRIAPVLGIGAMPSLHVAAQAFFAFWARRRSRFVFRLAAACTALTLFGSVVTGWHYALDGYAGLALAWASARAGERLG